MQLFSKAQTSYARRVNTLYTYKCTKYILLTGIIDHYCSGQNKCPSVIPKNSIKIESKRTPTAKSRQNRGLGGLTSCGGPVTYYQILPRIQVPNIQ